VAYNKVFRLRAFSETAGCSLEFSKESVQRISMNQFISNAGMALIPVTKETNSYAVTYSTDMST
jgi:hypothetical protein